MKFIISLFFITSLLAKDFGRRGTTFFIEEESLLDSMKCKAALHQSKLKEYAEEIENYIQNPPAIPGIGKAIEKRSWLYDPKIDAELPGGMLFFDGSDPAQVDWAKKQPSDFKWVLVKGSPMALEEQENCPVYYDQLGLFTTRFQIKNVPAKVFQEGRLLKIEEIPVP